MGNILQAIRRIPDCLIGREGKEEEEVFLLRRENIAEAISCDLPGDLMLNIMSRLPVKSLCRFKCVCKAWRTLVVSPTFINMHFSCKANTNNKLLVCPYRGPFWDFLPGSKFIYTLPSQIITNEQHYDRLYLPFRPSNTDENISIVGSSNGLVCIKGGHYDSSQPPPFVLWNPATKESRFLLPPPRIRDLLGGCLCFNFPYEDYTCLGVKFTYVGSIGDYKLVSVWHNIRNRSICVDAFSLAKNSWKRSIEYTKVRARFSKAGCVMVDGELHLLAGCGFFYLDVEWFVFSFDMGEEKFRCRRVPCDRGFRLRRSLAVLNQSQLAMFVYPNQKCLIGESIQIWVKVMGSYWTWTKHSDVKMPSLSVDIGVPIGFWPIKGGEEEEEEEEIIFTTGELFLGFGPTTWKNTLYNPRDGRFRNISGFPDFVPDFTPYVETLFSVKEIGGGGGGQNTNT